MAKVKVSFTLDEEVAKDVAGYHRELVADALKSNKPIPKLSNIYEEIVKKGWEQTKRRGK